MEKSKTGASSKSTKSTAANTGNKNKKGGATNVDTKAGTTSKVKSKVGHGMANEGTTGTYEGEDR